MSAIVLDGIRYAAGLEWLPRGNAAQTAREARRGDSVWVVHCDRQTGYAGESAEHEAGMAALAATLKETIPEDLWLALVEGEQGKFALVQAKDGEILADGDKVLDSIEEVRRALASMEETDWAVYATSGLVDDATVLDTRALRAAAGELVRSGTVLRAAPLAGVTRGKVVQAVLGVVVVGGILAGWSFRDELVLLFVGPPPAVKKAEKKKEQRIATVIDSVALVSGCREGIRRHTPGMPGWKLQRVTCAARFSKRRWSR